MTELTGRKLTLDSNFMERTAVPNFIDMWYWVRRIDNVTIEVFIFFYFVRNAYKGDPNFVVFL